MKFSLKSEWDISKNEMKERKPGGARGVLEFNTYLRREGCWEITHIDTWGKEVSKKAPKFNTYYLNGPLPVK